MKNRALLGRFSLLAALFLGLLSGMSAALAADAANAAAGVILALSGKVEIIHDKQTRTAASRAELFSGDTVVTASDGQAQIRFADGTLLTLYRDTKFAVEDFQFGKGKADRAQFSLLNGLMHTLTGQMEKDKYQVKTRLANLGVRGTEYSAQLGSALLVSVDQGSVVVANAGGSILVGAGSNAIVTGVNAIPKPTNIKTDLRGGAGGAGGRGGPGGGPGGPGGGAGGGPAGGPSGGGAAPAPPPPGTKKI